MFSREFNLPNKITIARIVMIFIFLALANVGGDSIIGRKGLIHVSEDFAHGCHVAAYLLAIIAGLSDILDGYIARKYDMISEFGQLMDPLADKIFITATFLMIVEAGLMPAWVAVVVISREFMVTGLRTLAASQGETIAADGWGKFKTFLQMMMLLVGGASWVGWLPSVNGKIYWQAILWAIVFVTVYSGTSYFVRHRQLYIKDT
jgi:CDP-diacylglycerol--glycerol-3-phosphate 3-phosphatidyltransferase